ncbi:MAG: NYN domain-containing protein [Actinomycetota bacterium]|nr:NYN domain-containing protein [Actinomycetota bacterium]
MLFLIDGYNITKGDPATRSLSLEEQRDGLLARLAVRGADLLGQGEIVVVFDGEGGAGLSSASHGTVRVRFSRDRSADDVLAQLAGEAQQPVCLVSSDRELAERVATHACPGAEVRPREALYEGARPARARRRSARYPARAVGLPAGANRVTEELKKLWLPEDKE